MATHLEVVNRVLVRLREDKVVSTNVSEYAGLVAEFVADSYAEVVDDHSWESLKHKTKVDVLPAQVKYDLTRSVAGGGGARNTDPRVCSTDSELQFLSDMPQVWMYDDDVDDTYKEVAFIAPEAFRIAKNRDRDEAQVDPYYMTLYTEVDTTASPAVSRLYMEVYPAPLEARVIELIFWTKPADLENDGTTDAVELLVPHRPVYHHALMTAYNERGEEIGEPGNLAERRYIASISTAIEKDVGVYQYANRNDWRRD